MEKERDSVKFPVELCEDDFIRTESDVIGFVLTGAQHDTNGNPINPNLFYWVWRHKNSMMMVILPSGRHQRDDVLNDALKGLGRLN